MRTYVPATLDLLRRWSADEEVPLGGAVRAVDEQEEAEYDALVEAAATSAELLASRGRRVVVVVETDETGSTAPWRDVAAVHADTEDVDPEDPDAPDLGWFATQEVPDLLA